MSSKEFWCVCMCVRTCLPVCVYSNFAVLLPVHNWCCAGILHICKLPVYSNTRSSHKQKSTKKQQDKQHQTSKFGTLFFVSTSTSPYLPSYLCLLSSFPFLSLSQFILSLLCPSHHVCSQPFSPSPYPSPCPSLPLLLFTCHSVVLILLPLWVFLSNIHQQPLRVSNLLETLSKKTTYLFSTYLFFHTTKTEKGRA